MFERLASRWWQNLRGRLILLALVALLPPFGVSLFLALEARQQAIEDAQASVQRMVANAADDISTQIQSTRLLVRAMAANPFLGSDDFAACSNVLAAYLARDRRYSGFAVVDRDGRLLCSSDPSSAGVNFSDREHFQRALSTRDTVVGKPVVGRVSRRAVIAVDQPLLDAGGEVRRVLLAELDLALLSATSLSADQSANFTITISDDGGRVFHRWPDNEKWAGEQGQDASVNQALRTRSPGEAFQATGLDGVSRIFAFQPLRDYPQRSVLVRAGAAIDELTATADREVALSVVMLVAFGILALAGAIYLSEKFVRGPIAVLAQAATRLGEADLAQRIPESSFHGELSELAVAFNRMAAALAAHIARVESVIESAPDPIFIVDGQGRIVVANAQAQAAFGYSREELIGLAFDVLVPQQPDAAHSAGLDLRACRKDGSEFVANVNVCPLETAEGTLSIWTVRDVSERVQAENEIRGQRAFLRQVIDLDRNLIFAKDRQGRFTLANQAVADAYGTTVEELIGKSDFDLDVNREEAEHFRRDDADVMDNLQEKFNAEERLTDAGGTARWLQMVKRPIVNAHGRADMVLAVATDISERKESELRLRRQLEHLALLDQITRATGERQDLQSIFQAVVGNLEESLPIDFGCVCLHDAGAASLSVSSVGTKSAPMAQALGLRPGDPIGIDANGLSRCLRGQLVHEPDVRQIPFPFPQKLAAGGLCSLVLAPLKSESRVFGVLVAARRDAGAFSSLDCEFLRQLSEHVALAAAQAQLHESLQRAYDDLRATQQSAMQEERLRALGQMASGIAHDINNALSPVSLYTESMLQTETNLSARARGYLETIQRAVEDVAHTVARMREFYRQREQQLELAPVDANQAVQQVLSLTKARWSDMAHAQGVMIQVRTELTTGLPLILGVESEIREALTNLVFNAVDAMPGGGTLTLRTRLVDGDADDNPSVILEVIDNGVGMDDKTRQRCMEPFFTTKGDRGTGLGLAMVFGMAQRHSCGLEIDSAPNAGTTVRLVFRVPSTIGAEPAPTVDASQVPSRLRLLLVDDDPVLLKSLSDVLQGEGHVVVASNGGAAGITAFRASLSGSEPFEAVVTDLGMPYVDGRKVAAAVKESSPGTPVVLLTGWGQRLLADGETPPYVDRVIAKPPKMRELREALALLCRRTGD